MQIAAHNTSPLAAQLLAARGHRILEDFSQIEGELLANLMANGVADVRPETRSRLVASGIREQVIDAHLLSLVESWASGIKARMAKRRKERLS